MGIHKAMCCVAFAGVLLSAGCGVSRNWDYEPIELGSDKAKMFAYDATVRGQLVVYQPVWVNLQTGATSESAPPSDVASLKAQGIEMNEGAPTILQSENAISVNGRVVWRREMRVRTFSEAKPDAAREQSLELAIATALKATLAGMPFDGKGDVTLKFAEKIVTLAARTERVEILRDALMRLAEANFNHAISGDDFVRSYNNTLSAVVKLAATEVILELEQLRQELATANKTLDKLVGEFDALKAKLTEVDTQLKAGKKPEEIDKDELLKSLKQLSEKIDAAKKEKARIEGLIEENNKLKDQILRAIGGTDSSLLTLIDKKIAAETNLAALSTAKTAWNAWNAASGSDIEPQQKLAAKAAAAAGVSPPDISKFAELGLTLESAMQAKKIEIKVLDELIQSALK